MGHAPVGFFNSFVRPLARKACAAANASPLVTRGMRPVSLTYDELGRVETRSIGGVRETVGYDDQGRLTTTDNDILGHFGREYYGVTGRLWKLTYPNGQETKYFYFNNDRDLRLQTIQNLVGGVNISVIDRENHKKVPEGGSTLVESGVLTQISCPFQPDFTKRERTP